MLACIRHLGMRLTHNGHLILATRYPDTRVHSPRFQHSLGELAPHIVPTRKQHGSDSTNTLPHAHFVPIAVEQTNETTRGLLICEYAILKLQPNTTPKSRGGQGRGLLSFYLINTRLWQIRERQHRTVAKVDQPS
mgnify:FL=1